MSKGVASGVGMDGEGGGGAAAKKAQYAAVTAESAVCNVSIHAAGVRTVPAFLIGKSQHAQLFTPVSTANGAVATTGAKLLQLNGDYFSLAGVEAEAASSFYASVALRDATNRTQTAAWLTGDAGLARAGRASRPRRRAHDPAVAALETRGDQAEGRDCWLPPGEDSVLCRPSPRTASPVDPLVALQRRRKPCRRLIPQGDAATGPAERALAREPGRVARPGLAVTLVVPGRPRGGRAAHCVSLPAVPSGVRCVY